MLSWSRTVEEIKEKWEKKTDKRKSQMKPKAFNTAAQILVPILIIHIILCVAVRQSWLVVRCIRNTVVICKEAV